MKKKDICLDVEVFDCLFLTFLDLFVTFHCIFQPNDNYV